jgi:aminoglycoside phosphotransferase (APT) family kinase protein
MRFEDRPRAVRAGEELDPNVIRAFLSEALGREVGEVEISQFPGGHSNLTYLVRAGDEELVLRRPPFGSKVKRAHDMGREHRVLERLARWVDWAPEPVAHCADESLIGAEFYLMRRVRGIILRRSVPEGLTIDAERARKLSETLLDTLVELHGLDPERVGLSDLGHPEGYVERQVVGWTNRYHDAVTDEIAEMPRVATWLAEEMPPSGPGVIIHNDYKFDNVVYHETLERIIGVLDWEMATVGDALMDLGTSLSYWVEATDSDAMKNIGFGPTVLPGMYSRKELADRYAEKTGRDLSSILFYYVFGLFKTAVVLQQIYYRYKQGLTKDERFAGLIFGVRLLAATADAAIARGTISVAR